MPRAAAPPNSVRVAYEGTYGPASWAVVHWFMAEPNDTATQAQFNDLVDALGGFFKTRFVARADISNHVQFNKIRASWTDMSGALIRRTLRPADGTGTNSGHDAPAQVCYLIDWQAGDPRRGGKPRSYLCGVTTDSLEDEVRLNPAGASSLSDAAQGYIDDVAGLSSAPFTPISFVEMSFRAGNAYRVDPVQYTIDGGICSAEVATQRRRVDRLRT